MPSPSNADTRWHLAWKQQAYLAAQRSINAAVPPPPPNSLPAPRVTDMKSWFATYGHPSMSASGSLSEFSQTTKSVPRGEGMPSQQVKLFRGRVLH